MRTRLRHVRRRLCREQRPLRPRDYSIAANASARDLRAAIDAMKSRADVSTSGMIAVGVSAGGFATIALTADPPPGLAAAHQLRRRPRLARRQRRLRPGCAGARIRRARAGPREFRCCGSMRRTTSSSGPTWRTGCTRHSPAPADAPDSSTRRQSATTAICCFLAAISIWTPMVDAFLREQNLGTRDIAGRADAQRWRRRRNSARRDARNFPIFSPPARTRRSRCRRRAPSPTAAEGARRTRPQDAALAACAEYAPDCALYAADDELAGRCALNKRIAD